MKEFRQKEYTRWDETDSLKQMRDSDILAEQKKKNPSRLGGAAKSGFIGAGTGAVLGGIAGGLLGKKRGISGIVSGITKGARKGAIAGGAIGAVGGATLSGSKERKENNFYNDRLEYAQRQALRREKRDWKKNMTGREGYSYAGQQQKEYTRWDETDSLKQMRDSDILAEQKKKNPSRLGGAAKVGAVTGAIGAGAGAAVAGGLGMYLRKKGVKLAGSTIAKATGKTALKFGGAAAGVGALGGALFKGNKQRKENNAYNDRLEYAQRQALRREKRDWTSNNTNREGYTY